MLKIDASPALMPERNPLLGKHDVETVDLELLGCPVVHARSRAAIRRRLILDQRRVASARDAVSALSQDVELYGFTKGQFSLLDLLVACLEKTGPAALDLSTWTAARHEIERLAQLRDEGKMTAVRFLMDVSFARRDPTAAHMIRQAFGVECVRVAQTHAKFALFGNENWRLVLQTSMNLNMNPRFEDYRLAHDPEVFDFLSVILAEVWSKQKTLRMEDAPEARRIFAESL